VNLLKVDIEGGEWGVFNSMFSDKRHLQQARKHTEQPSLPVGQLIIELHYHSMDSIEQFFTGAEKFGLLPFSREINLQPCIGGGKPVAAEYSFIHADHYFSEDKEIAHLEIPAPFTESWHVPIKAVIYFLTQRVRTTRMAGALKLLYENFWRDYPYYDIVIFQDDLRDADKKELMTAVPHMPLRFVSITLSTPAALQASGKTIPDRTVCAPGSSTLGYRHMCRFHATVVHHQLELLGYGDYDYVMRLDDDSLISFPIGYDVFRFMKENNKKYAFTNMVADEPACVVNLWQESGVFFNTTMEISASSRSSSLFSKWPEGVVFYNNFEISALSLWKSPVWRAYIDHIDNIGGIYTLRWGDAPLHTIGVTMMLDRHEIHAFTDISYRHDPFIDQTPTGLPMPNMDPFVGPNVVCHYYDQWMCFYTHGGQNISSNGTYNSSVSLIFNGSYSIESLLQDHSMKHIHYINASAGGSTSDRLALYSDDININNNADAAAVDTSFGRGQTVLYTFAHAQREHLLAATLRSIYDNYLSLHPSQVVVFYSDSGSFDVEKSKKLLGTSPLEALLMFRPVALTDSTVYSVDLHCVSTSEEVRGSSIFFRQHAVKLLKALGFTWLFRFSDDARLLSRVKESVFERLHAQGALYGYRNAMETRDECVSDLWEISRNLCGFSNTSELQHTLHRYRHRHQRQLRKEKIKRESTPSSQQIQCQPGFHDWTPNKVIFTSFEVSHISVWETPVCQNLLTAADALAPGSEKKPLWPDSAIHTLCVVSALRPEQYTVLRDVEFRFNWSHADWTDDLQDATKRFKSTRIAAFDRSFAAQKVGWLGGDVAASISLPNPTDFSAPPSRSLWLFGDTIIGVSNEEKRLKEFSSMISNSVGLMVLDDDSTQCERSIKSLAYFWNTDSRGQPSAVLALPTTTSTTSRTSSGNSGADAVSRAGGSCSSEQQRVWPIGGISVVAAAGHVVLLILAQIVCLSDGLSAESLQFRGFDTALFVVHNPFDSPQSWHYEAKLFPKSNSRGKYQWISLAASSGASFARENESIYILGSLHKHDNGAGSAGFQVLGRAPANRLVALDLDSLEIMSAAHGLAVGSSATPSKWVSLYHRAASTTPTATPSAANAVPFELFKPLVSEASLHYDPRLREWLAVSLHFLKDSIQVCRVHSLESVVAGWNCSFVSKISAAMEQDSDKLVNYAAKAHPHLLLPRPDCNSEVSPVALDLVISYVSNAAMSSEILFETNYKTAYTPKFLRVRELIL